MKWKKGFRLTPDDTSPVGMAFRRVGFWTWAKEVLVGRTETFMYDGSTVIRYQTPPDLYDALAAWYATGVWTLADGKLNFAPPPPPPA
jgi:hypothetical protein